MKKYYFSIICLFIVAAVSGQYTWSVKDTFPGSGRRMAAGLNISGKAYIIGGNISSTPFTTTNDVWEYDPSSDSWTQKANFPTNIATASYFTINNVGYVVGGSTSAGNAVSTTRQYNASNDSWSTKASFPENGISGAFQFVLNNLGYVGTGARTGSNNASTVYSYNPETDSWIQAASYLGPQSINMTAFAIDSFAYAGLGQNGSGAFFNQFYKYNPTNNTWGQVATFPGKSRSAAISFVLNGKAYVGGGVSLLSGVPYALGDFYEYDPSSNTWSALPGFPGAPRQYATPVVINSVAYSICGYDDDGDKFYNLVSEFGTCSTIAGILPIPGENNTGIQIYPNPSSSDVTVKINSQGSTEIKYEIVAVEGKVIKTGTTRQNSFGFNSSNLADGIYIINVNDNQGVHGAQRFEVIH